eukprot:TRINITY_DN23232_c0_g1_i1.p2 TRINITY_DN23232_c0_g1~~TRINITY_DN23232_c0_g1_i1.p2  ORF type:complete len:118 (+),score=0.53 TRINITY_DN23232_c0_g1_i1:47-400(+)
MFYLLERFFNVLESATQVCGRSLFKGKVVKISIIFIILLASRNFLQIPDYMSWSFLFSTALSICNSCRDPSPKDSNRYVLSTPFPFARRRKSSFVNEFPRRRLRFRRNIAQQKTLKL